MEFTENAVCDRDCENSAVGVVVLLWAGRSRNCESGEINQVAGVSILHQVEKCGNGWKGIGPLINWKGVVIVDSFLGEGTMDEGPMDVVEVDWEEDVAVCEGIKAIP